MRPKFRAWDSAKKEMFKDTFAITESGQVVIVEQESVVCHPDYVFVDYLVIMQSTGLVDKNGKEIFEGDIIANGPDVMCMKRHNTLGFYVEKKGKVDFIADCAVLEEFEEDAKEIADSLEIIGNIYENPELLEKENENQKIVAVISVLSALLLLTACRESEKVSYNVSQEADNFNIVRRVAVINTRTDKVEFEVIGRISVETEANEGKRLEILVETAKGVYKKHMVNLTSWNMYVVEDLEGAEVDQYKYEVNYMPESIIPFKVTKKD